MHVYLIEYDLNRPGQNYPELIDAIKALGAWCHHLKSAWLVLSSASSVQVRDALLPQIDRTDDLMVMKLSGEAAWYGLSDEVSSWIRDRLQGVARA